MIECRTITVAQAGKTLGIGRLSAYAAVKRGEIPSLRIGRRLVVPVTGLERILEQAGRPVEDTHTETSE